MVEPGSSLQISEALLELLADDEGRKKMGSEGYKYVTENYGWKKIAEKTLALYRRVSQG